MLRWHFMHSQCCAITTSVWFQNISITPREFLYSLTATLSRFSHELSCHISGSTVTVSQPFPVFRDFDHFEEHWLHPLQNVPQSGLVWRFLPSCLEGAVRVREEDRGGEVPSISHHIRVTRCPPDIPGEANPVLGLR